MSPRDPVDPGIITCVILKREAQLLKAKALASLRRGAAAFNDFDDIGRTTAVLLHTQHAFEMLLKGALVQKKVTVFSKRDGRSIGYEKCVNLGCEHLAIKPSDAGLLRAVDALRDDEQHWLTECSEGVLYLHVRAAVTLFDDMLNDYFSDRLVNHWPHRVLPMSAEPPRDIQVLIDEEYNQIAMLLAPGVRRRPDARAHIRSLLALEAHVVEGAIVSKRDVDRIERAVKQGRTRKQVFPSLNTLGSEVAGEGVTVTVRFSKTEGMGVRLARADEQVDAAAFREIDMQAKFHWTRPDLATKLGLTQPKCLALRKYLKIEEDERYRHDFTFGKQVHRQYSDNAYKAMRDALNGGLDMDEVWAACRPGARSR